ncbi:hypothetical protein [Actinomadura rudentiformis]|nr:hypothetical protein [Actinomadura rudentiformis]
MRDFAHAQGIEFFSIADADHGGAIRRPDEVLPRVLPFLLSRPLQVSGAG